MATPDDVVSFLIWKDVRGKTKVHVDSCPAFGTKKPLKCACPTRFAFGPFVVDWEAESDLYRTGPWLR